MALFSPDNIQIKGIEVRDLDKFTEGAWKVCRNRDCKQRKKLGRTVAVAVEQDDIETDSVNTASSLSIAV